MLQYLYLTYKKKLHSFLRISFGNFHSIFMIY
nr:MAG TPA: hypothetical protein [Microviridae sp.]